jgi:translation initiation factor IF-3
LICFRFFTTAQVICAAGGLSGPPTPSPYGHSNTPDIERYTLRRSRRRFRPQAPETEQHRINHHIRVPRVLLIDEEGNKLGVMPTRDALELAMDRGMDLIEVAPTARPPVCRVGDYGRLKYDRKKREADARKNRSTVQLKEIKVRPKTDDHDIEVKARNAHRFLEAGNKVKITVWFRGREHAHHDVGAEQCHRIARMVASVGRIERQPAMDGRCMFMILAPGASS